MNPRSQIMENIENMTPITQFKKHMDTVLKQASVHHEPVIVTRRGKPVFVILDMETFDKLRSAESFLNVLARTDLNIEGERKIR